MLHRLGEIKKLWHLVKKYKIGIITVAIIAVLAIAYSALPYPKVEGADEKGATFKVSFDAPFTLHFSGMMNRSSVEKAFRISPEVDGQFIWPDRKTLEYKPSETMKIDDRFRIVIGGEARSIFGKKLGPDAVLQFVVTGPPYVQFVSPKFTDSESNSGSNGDILNQQSEPQPEHRSEPQSETPIVSPNQIVTVMFDRPMQWPDFSEVSPEETLLVIEPVVKGEFRFLGMSAFQFIPENWPMGTRFKLTVPAGIQARDGGETEKELSWSVETPPLKVISADIESDTENAEVDSPITLRFNQPVELDQIKPGATALLYPSNDLDADKNPKMDGFFNTEVTYGEGAEGKPDKSVLVFKPTFPYLYGTEYRFLLKAGLSNSSETDKGRGAIGMKEDFELKFKTEYAPGVAQFGAPSDEKSSLMVIFSTPMTVEEIKKNMVITPAPENEPGVILDEKNTEAEIIFDYLPETDYIFEFKEGGKDIAGNEIKQAFKQSFKTPSQQTRLRWEKTDELEFFIEGMDPEFNLRTENLKKLTLNFCVLSEKEFISGKGSWGNYDCSLQNKILPISAESETRVLSPAVIFNEDLSPGIYYFSAEAEGTKVFKLFIINSTTLVLKKSSGGALVWATDTITGEPVARMELDFYDFDGNEMARGVTDGNGVYKVTRELGEGVYVAGSKDLGGETKWGMISEYWLLPVKNAFQEGSYEWIDQSQNRAYITVDKNSIHPGEQFNIKGIWRIDTDAQLSLPEEKQADVSLEDAEGNSVIKNTIPLRRDGSFDAVFNIPANTVPGKYTLKAYTASGELISSNKVDLNVRETNPPFEMKWMNPQKDHYAGTTVDFDLQAHYMMGMPAASMKGQWDLYRKPYYYDYHKVGAFFSFGGIRSLMCSKDICGSGDEFVNNGEFMFDKDGIAKISLTKPDGSLLDAGYEYLLVAESESADGVKTSETLRFKIHSDNRYVGLNIGHYILKPGDVAEGYLFVAGPDGGLIAEDRVRITLARTKNEQEGKIWFDKMVDLDADVADISIPLNYNIPGGTYKLKAETESGSFAELELYVISEKQEKLGDNFAILPDQPEYFVGGKAELVIHYPNASEEHKVNTLVTYERGDILGYQIVELSSPITHFTIPVREDMTPDMQISATIINSDSKKIEEFIKDQKLRRKEAMKKQSEAKIPLLENELQVLKKAEEPDEEKISQLKDEIEKLKKESESANEPVRVLNDPASLFPSFEVANAVILISKQDREIKIDMTSEPENPGPGEEVKLKVKTYDYQNRPVPAVVLVNLINRETELDTPFDFFYMPRASQIFTSSNFSREEGKAEKFMDILSVDDDYAKDAVDYSAYFNPIVLTNDAGEGEAVFTLPNEYNAWFINAVATNGAKNFGFISKELSIKKSLLIKPMVPSFVTPGDKMAIGAYVQNLSGKNMETKIELIAEGLDIGGGSKQNISIKAGESIRVSWDIAIDPYNDKEELKITIKSPEDEISAVLPVKRLNITGVMGGGGILSDEWNGKLRLPGNACPNLGGLSITLSGTPSGTIKNILEEIERYSPQSTENFATQLLASVLKKNFVSDDESVKAVDEEIEKTVADIGARQNPDGGYSFFSGLSESDPWLSAYVMFALSKAGVTDEDQKYTVQYLWSALNSQSSLESSDHLFILWALSEVKQYDTALSLTAFKERDTGSIAGKAFLLMNIQNLVDAGQKSAYPFLERLQSELASDKYSEDDMTYFRESLESHVDTGIKSTAVALMALNRTTEENPMTAPIVRYLVSSVTDVMERYNPQEAIWLALALSEFSEKQDMPSASYTVKADVNGRNILNEKINSDNIGKIFEKSMPLNSLKSPDEINEVDISKDGVGAPYYIAQLRYYAENDKISPLEEGVLITHNYYNLEDFYALKPLTKIQPGKLYRGVVTVIIPKDIYYATIEESIPAGMKVLSLNPAVANASWQYEMEEKAKNEGVNWFDSPLWNFEKAMVGDDNITLFASVLPAGVYNIDYLVQTGSAGMYNHLPAIIKQIFNPSVYARTEGGWVEVK